MVPRESLLLIALATAFCVATSSAAAVASSSSVEETPAEAIDFDLTGDVDYEVVPDADEDKSVEPDVAAEATRPDAAATQQQQQQHHNTGSNSPANHHQHHHHHPHHHNNNNNQNNNNNSNKQQQQQQQQHSREVRCYCNQPFCVSTNYMCRGHGCFTDLPIIDDNTPTAAVGVVGYARYEQPVVASYSGCLDDSFNGRACPRGKLCCEQDLCNHIDSPAMRLRLNKTLQALLNDRRSREPKTNADEIPLSEAWFRMATIAIPICGFVILVVLASLAIRLLQPIPLMMQTDKLHGLKIPENAPPLLGTPKLPLV